MPITLRKSKPGRFSEVRFQGVKIAEPLTQGERFDVLESGRKIGEFTILDQRIGRRRRKFVTVRIGTSRVPGKAFIQQVDAGSFSNAEIKRRAPQLVRTFQNAKTIRDRRIRRAAEPVGRRARAVGRFARRRVGGRFRFLAPAGRQARKSAERARAGIGRARAGVGRARTRVEGRVLSTRQATEEVIGRKLGSQTPTLGDLTVPTRKRRGKSSMGKRAA